MKFQSYATFVPNQIENFSKYENVIVTLWLLLLKVGGETRNEVSTKRQKKYFLEKVVIYFECIVSVISYP